MHRKEPWCVSATIGGEKLPQRVIIMQADASGKPLMEPPIADLGFVFPEVLDNAHRIVVCVNGTAHIQSQRLHLLAAADDLLAACEAVLKLPEHRLDEAPALLRPAVAKAKGGA